MPVTAHTTSRISDFTALDPLRYLTACAFVIVLRVAIVSSISQSDLAPPDPEAQTRRPRRTFLYDATKPTTRTFLLSQRDLLWHVSPLSSVDVTVGRRRCPEESRRQLEGSERDVVIDLPDELDGPRRP